MNKLQQIKNFGGLYAQWIGAGLKPVHPDQSQKRANICLKCPHNDMTLTIADVFKGKVADTVRRQIELKNHMQLRVEGEKRLGICDICECVLRLKVHVPLQFIDENTDEETAKLFPEHCWYVQEKKENP